MKQAIIWIVVLILVIVGVAKWAGNDKKSTINGPVKVGAIMPLTGDIAAYGEAGRNIYSMALKEINDAGGVDGQPIELIIEDSQCSGDAAASAVQKLVNVDKVQVIIGGFCSGESLAAVPIADAGKVALLSPGSSSPDLTNISKYFARNYPSDDSQGNVLADVAYNKENYKTVYAIVEQTEYATGVVRAFTATFSGYGGKITKEEIPTSATDVKSVVSKAKASNSDAILISSQTPALAMRLFKAMRDLQWHPKFLLNDAPAADPGTVSANLDLLEGSITAEFAVDMENSVMKHALNLYKDTYKQEMPYQNYGHTEYDALFIVRDALKEVGNDGTKIAEWLRTSVKNWKGASGLTTIGSNGDRVSGFRPEIIKAGILVPYTK